MRAIALSALGGLFAIAALSCSSRSREAASDKLEAFAAIPPLADFAERLGGDRVRVGVLVAPGQSPHTYEPTPKQIAALAGARVYFSIGMPFERVLLQKVLAANKSLKVVDARQGVALRRMTEAEAEPTEEGGKPEDHDHAAGAPDFHVWLSPRNAKTIAANIAEGLSLADPDHAADYAKKLAELQADLDRLDAKLKEALAPLRGREFMVFHPAFGYFADAYGLRQVPVEIEGKEPSAKQLTALIERARKQGVRVIFVQPQFSPRSAEAVAREIGGAVVPLDDLARDYFANLGDMAEKIRAALAPQAAPPAK